MKLLRALEGERQFPSEAVSEFTAVFARFEYALKRTGFYMAGKGAVRADWDAFAAAVGNPMEALRAGKYLLEMPPRRQVVRNGKLEWADDEYEGIQDLARLLVLVRRVRNNLFHGGKLQESPSQLNRDIGLIESATAVLWECVKRHAALRREFVDDLPVDIDAS